jgi:cytosine/adenosine deaminase-related metal-dependent hydrolase
MSNLRPDPQRAERNLRTLAMNGIRAGLGTVQAYPQDIVDLLGELERALAAAISVLELIDPTSVQAQRVERQKAMALRG